MGTNVKVMTGVAGARLVRYVASAYATRDAKEHSVSVDKRIELTPGHERVLAKMYHTTATCIHVCRHRHKFILARVAC